MGRFLKVGDKVELEVERIGILTNYVVVADQPWQSIGASRGAELRLEDSPSDPRRLENDGPADSPLFRPRSMSWNSNS